MKPINTLAQKFARPGAVLLAFAAVNLLWRLLFLPASQSAYTDGILQIDMFHFGVSYWPPLYALLARALAWVPGLGLEGAARLVSLLSGVAVLAPLAAVARRLFGQRAAFWAMAAWTATPLALQWSLQVMTDMPFTLLWMGALAAALLALAACRPGAFPGAETAPPPSPQRAFEWLLIASAAGALATLTRYQGLLLLPLLAAVAGFVIRACRALPGRSRPLWLALLPWLAVPAWLFQGMSSITRHAGQIGQRTGAGPWQTAVNYAYIFEEFLLKSPYFLTYGLFGFMLYGLFRVQWSTPRLRWTGWACLYLALTIFSLQAVFSSYQARYLLPLVPLACLFAGHGLAVWERHAAGRPLRFWGLAAPTLALGLGFSALVATWQGSPFKEIKEGALFVRSLNLAEGRRVLSNEFFNETLGPVKVEFWSGRPAYWLGTTPPAPGDIVVLNSYNEGSLARYNQLRAGLIQSGQARELRRFRRTALPLITDIMQEGGTAQNPLAWQLRYLPQHYETSVLEVIASSAAESQPGAAPLKPIPPLAPGLTDRSARELEAIQQGLRQLKP